MLEGIERGESKAVFRLVGEQKRRLELNLAVTY